MPIDRNAFIQNIQPLFAGHLQPAQIAGMNAILTEWEKRSPAGDHRWLAYMFATSFHETARKMQPVREAFWMTEEWRRTHLTYYPYYGRGYVQLTWRDNYRRAGDYVRDALVASPDLALRPDYAAAIMFVGMGEGWFRSDHAGNPHKLARYFGPHVDDPEGARDIINGAEWVTIGGKKVLLATIIARYHQAFLAAIEARLAEAVAEADIVTPFDAADAAPAGGLFANFDLRDDAIVSGLRADAGAPDAFVALAAQIVTGYVGHNTIAYGDVPDFLLGVHAALLQMSAGGPPADMKR